MLKWAEASRLPLEQATLTVLREHVSDNGSALPPFRLPALAKQIVGALLQFLRVADSAAALAFGERLGTQGLGLRSWLAPHAEIDLRIGGLMRTNSSSKGALGDPETIENRILSFEPGRMFSIQVSKAPVKFPFPSAIARMWTAIYLEPAEPARTRLRVVGLGFGPDEESQKMRAFFEKGNAVTVDQLRRRFEKDAR